MSSGEDIVIKEEKIIFYSNDEATVTIDVYFVDEIFWLSQKSMSKLFDVYLMTNPKTTQCGIFYQSKKLSQVGGVTFIPLILS